MILWLFTYMLIPKVVDNSASSNIQPPIFWYVVCIHETQLFARWTPKSELSVIGSFLWPKSATKMILITLLTKSTPPNEIICINDHSEVWISHFCHRTPASSDSVIGLETVKKAFFWLYISQSKFHIEHICLKIFWLPIRHGWNSKTNYTMFFEAL